MLDSVELDSFEETAAKLDLNQSLGKLKALYLRLRNAYYNEQELVTDKEYDRLEDYLKEKDPHWEGLKKVGAPIKNKKVAVKLPISMPSLNKAYPPDIDAWLQKCSSKYVVVMEKLDGGSLELIYRDGLPTNSYTRGNGIIGKEMSYLVPHMKIPKKIAKANVIVRCEGLFTKQVFLKYNKEFKVDRGAANGILNAGTPHKALKDLSVVVLQVLKPNVKMSAGLKWAKSKGFTVVPWRVFATVDLNADKLSKMLANRKKLSHYKCDGLVIAEDQVNPVPKGENPKWAIAFKENTSVKTAPKTKVLRVIWQMSSHGYLVPKVEVEPTDFDGSTVRFCSVYNTRWMLDKKVGPGALVALVRSGDIIPRIIGVLKPGKSISKPDKKEFGDYELNKGGTDYVLLKPKENPLFRVKHITRCLVTLGIDFMKEATVQRLFDAGMINVKQVINATAKDFAEVEGIKTTSAEKFYKAIHSIIDRGIPLPQLMDASGVFPRGIGTRRVEMISEVLDLNKLMKGADDTKKVANLISTSVPGFKVKTAEMFATALPKFVKWQKIVGIKGLKPILKIIKSGVLGGRCVSFTGYRDHEQAEIIENNGGQVVSFGSRTSILLYSPTGKQSSKTEKAKAKGIEIMTWDQLVKKFRLK
jgi:DNA ligase (NAD+)